MAASQVVRPWKSSRASARGAPSCSNSRALDLGGGSASLRDPQRRLSRRKLTDTRSPWRLSGPLNQTGLSGAGLAHEGGEALNAGAVHRVSSPSRCTRGSSSAPGHPSGTQHQPGKTRAPRHSKITWAFFPSKTIVAPIFGQIKSARSLDRFRLRGLTVRHCYDCRFENPRVSNTAAGPRRNVRHAPKRHTKGLCWGTIPFTELSCIAIFQFIPWEQLGQLDPAVVGRIADVITILDDLTITVEKQSRSGPGIALRKQAT